MYFMDFWGFFGFPDFYRISEIFYEFYGFYMDFTGLAIPKIRRFPLASRPPQVCFEKKFPRGLIGVNF
jgi:hypothetical protein